MVPSRSKRIGCGPGSEKTRSSPGSSVSGGMYTRMLSAAFWLPPVREAMVRRSCPQLVVAVSELAVKSSFQRFQCRKERRIAASPLFTGFSRSATL